MLDEPGPLLARGRAADVFEYGARAVLRRYRTDHDCVYEAAVMQHVRSHGYPTPEVFAVAGRDLVMERIDGPTMLEDFGRRPWTFRRHASTLADLLHRLHEIPPPEWLQDRIGGGDALVHLDLHPDNVMLSARGPIVIDWSNAGRGDADAEIADLWLIFACAQVPGGAIQRAVISAGRQVFASIFLKRFDLDAVRAKLAVAAEHRMRDRNMSEVEKERMRELVAKETR